MEATEKRKPDGNRKTVTKPVSFLGYVVRLWTLPFPNDDTGIVTVAA